MCETCSKPSYHWLLDSKHETKTRALNGSIYVVVHLICPTCGTVHRSAEKRFYIGNFVPPEEFESESE